MPTYEVLVGLVYDTRGQFKKRFIVDEPCPTITIGVDALNRYHYQIVYYTTDTPPDLEAEKMNKPPYRVPSMQEIHTTEWNGYNVISTFSGCGGSSLGYKMAGYRVLWANEFIPAAQETYRANHPNIILDTRDIREVSADSILNAIGMQPGELDVFDGSPPCASFSTSGKREQGWGKVKKYSDTEQRVDDLFFEYARIVKGVQPKVFVAENVSGLVKGTAKGYFLEILAALKDCGYNVQARLLDAQWLGVPQTRQRLIFVGVRNDLHLAPAYPKPLGYRYSVRDALPHIVAQGDNGGFGGGSMRPTDKPSPTIGADVKTGNGNFPPSLVEVEPEAYLDGYRVGEWWDEIKPGESHPEHFNLVKLAPSKPSPTITQTMGNAKGKVKYVSNVVHPYEKRYLSIGELKRICAFPDDFTLTGTYSQQWERLGRAVPPVMMYHIAKTLQTEVLDRCAALSAASPIR